MDKFDLSDMREVAYRMLDKRATVSAVRLTLAEQFAKYRFTLEPDGSIFVVPDANDYVKPTRVI